MSFRRNMTTPPLSDVPPRCWICGRNFAHAEDGAACSDCQTILQPCEQAWRRLAGYLRVNWRTITTRGSFDLSAVFPGAVEAQAVNVHLHFVRQLGERLRAESVAVDLATFSRALLGRRPHPEVTVSVADSNTPAGKLLSHDPAVSLLRQGEEVYSAVWTHLAHPIAMKVCYLKSGAPVREPEGFPWHPHRQRKIVKLSPYKSDAQPRVARRDLRI